MIQYYKGAFGLNLIFRLHGSAVYKSFIPGLVSVLIYWLYQNYYIRDSSTEDDAVDHPYTIGVLVSSVSFLIIFRANNSYQRYWSACGDVHHFMSKILDATVHAATFHMQCDHYAAIKPPTFFDYPELIGHNLSRDKEGTAISTISSHESISQRRVEKSINHVKEKYIKKSNHSSVAQDSSTFDNDFRTSSSNSELRHGNQSFNRGSGRLDGGWGLLDTPESNGVSNVSSTENYSNSFGQTPSLFLQELAHLSSLLIAVAFCTLRNDVDGAQSPLDTYIPGSDWPAVDPNHMSKAEKNETTVRLSWFQSFWFWIGVERTPTFRTKFNAARPMLVVGGVSENEIIQLQKARGASAKTTLAWYWLSEFLGREHLAGSTGAIGPPIISRLFQFLSDGMIFYNHARKTMFIPFPFPHAQISAIFIVVIVMAVPFMMNVFTNHQWLGASLTFLTVTCLAGLHEVGRELENPFRNTPNDIPLCTLLAMYNESLVVMCSGYHPDAYWNRGLPPKNKNKESKPDQQQHYNQLKTIIDRQAKEIKELQNFVKSTLSANDDLDTISKEAIL